MHGIDEILMTFNLIFCQKMITLKENKNLCGSNFVIAMAYIMSFGNSHGWLACYTTIKFVKIDSKNGNFDNWDWLETGTKQSQFWDKTCDQNCSQLCHEYQPILRWKFVSELRLKVGSWGRIDSQHLYEYRPRSL